ncbi:MAG: M14 family zinc carboxypeptidase, partial [Planctomycetota bacterium]
DKVWSAFVKQLPVLVLGINARTRGWNRVKGEKNDTVYALHVLDLVQKQHKVDAEQIYLAGFSSGSDFLCSGGLQLQRKFAGSLVVCPGPSNVVGLRGGQLLKVKDHPFYFVTGEEDYIRKNGAWQAFLALEGAGGKVMYREVPGVGHKFPGTDEYERALRYLQMLAGHAGKPDHLAIAKAAIARKDYLLASTHLLRLGADDEKAKQLLAQIEAEGQKQLAAAAEIAFVDEPGRAYEAWWHLRTQFHRFPKIAEQAQAELDKKREISNRNLMRGRRDYFRNRGGAATPTPAGSKKRQPAKQQPAKQQPAKQQPAKRQPVRRQRPRPASVRRDRELKKSPNATGPWSFDKYLSYDEVTKRLQLLARENPGRVRLLSMGKSVQGRDLWVCEITSRNVTKRNLGQAESKPAAYVEGGLHGNEISTVMTTLYFAWQMGANPDRRRSIDRALRDVTLYVAPMVNPDAVQQFVTEPNSMWRPRFNFRPHDADGDGKIDEDPYEDLNGDGQISQMYVPDPEGKFILSDGMVRRPRRGNDEDNKKQRYRPAGREGLDNDGDGRFSEDPPGGVNLNRNFPVGFRPRKDFEGFRGTGPASEPETQAIMKFVREHKNISLFLDYHNAAKCVFYWAGEGGSSQDQEDLALMAAMAGRAHKEMGYLPRPLDHSGVGLSIAWAYGELGILAGIVELEAGRLPQKEYFEKVWKGDVFVPARKFKHPQLGEILLGNDYKKLPRRCPHPSDIYWQVRRNWDWLRNELKLLPKLTVDQPCVRRSPDGKGFLVSGIVRNKGSLPMATNRATKLGTAGKIQISARGAKVAGKLSLEPLAAGAETPFEVALSEPGDSVTLVVRHPRGGAFEIPVLRPRLATVSVRKDYVVKAGYRTVADVTRADNDHYKNGVAKEERGPMFKVTKPGRKTLKVAVLLGEFADKRHIVPAEAFHDSMFVAGGFRGRSVTGQHVYGTLRDFYREMSYGQMEVAGKVFDWLELPGKFEEYRKASFGSSKFRDALEAAVLEKHGDDALDGYDGIVYLWAGNPVHRVSCLWPMRLGLKHRPGVSAFKAGEFYRGQMAPIGVACHEMGHTFGVNDKYGLGAPKWPMGSWCLMCKGTHGAGNSAQRRPFHMCAWCKMVIGWVKPVVVDPTAGAQKLALRPILYAPNECYRILLKPDGSEYLLLENRRQEGFMTELPSAGLVVLKVGPNTRPSAPQKQVQLLPAHGLPPASRSDLQKMEEIAWPQKGKTEVVVDGVKIANIRLVDDVVYFEVDTVSKD